MDIMNLSKEEMKSVLERYELAMERIREIEREEEVRMPLRDYFQKVSAFLILLDDVAQKVRDGSYLKLSLKELQAVNRSLYNDIIEDNYLESYANPTYACKKLGKRYGKLLSFLYTELRALIVFAFEKQIYLHTIYLELFI
ncbi:MAG: leucyl aminopeptidase, partial [Bacillota bacterium]|nr:leucyl aminopeptidase [Bacillota bacterium]